MVTPFATWIELQTIIKHGQAEAHHANAAAATMVATGPAKSLITEAGTATNMPKTPQKAVAINRPKTIS
jgi:hypothetical protein